MGSPGQRSQAARKVASTTWWSSTGDVLDDAFPVGGPRIDAEGEVSSRRGHVRLFRPQSSSASRLSPWTGDCSLVDEGDSPSARTAVCDDQNLVLVTLASARCRLAVGAHDPQRAFATRCSCSARRSRRTLRALRPRWSRWARRSRRTGLALFPRRPGRTGLPLWGSLLHKWKAQSQPRYFSHTCAHLCSDAPYSFTSGTNSPYGIRSWTRRMTAAS